MSTMIALTLNMMALYCPLFSDCKKLNTSEETKIHLLSWKERTKITMIAKFGGEIDGHVNFPTDIAVVTLTKISHKISHVKR